MDGWHAYDYRAGLGAEPAVNMFHPALPAGDAVWVDDGMWSIDDPESPDSVLALVRYDEWTVLDGRLGTALTTGDDLRGECVSFELRPEGLDLKGGHVTFWAMSGTVSQRWHVVEPLPTNEGTWSKIRLDLGDVVWRRSWSALPNAAPYLDDVLRLANSFGIAFVGFSDEPVGRLGLRNFELGC